MSNSKKNLFFVRSRFQPFTKFHGEIIKSHIEQGNQVVPCVIRDYETISRWHRMSPDVTNVDLRHLPIFNPLTSWEVYLHILSNLRKTITSDPPAIPIIISPLKFSELIPVMSKRGKIIPQDLAKFTEKHMCDEKTYKQCEIKDNLGKIISIVSYDIMPPKFEFVWLFGMFDLEDERDLNQAKIQFLVKEHEFSDLPPKYALEDLSPNLGLYGQFILWIYLQFVKSYLYDTPYKWKDMWKIEVPPALEDIDFLSGKIKELTNVLTEYLKDGDEWKAYSKKVSLNLTELLHKFDKIPQSERDVLLDYSRFKELAETSIKAYKD